jgi:hypothetical protein
MAPNPLFPSCGIARPAASATFAFAFAFVGTPAPEAAVSVLDDIRKAMVK